MKGEKWAAHNWIEHFSGHFDIKNIKLYKQWEFPPQSSNRNEILTAFYATHLYIISLVWS